jgi:hypothetical protein
MVNIAVLQAARFYLLLIAHPNELCSFSGFVGVNDGDLIRDNADGEPYIVD